MTAAELVIGGWYRRPNGTLFEVVALDEDDATIELQFFDGTIDEIDMDRWPKMMLEAIDAPEDWSGSVDMDPEDFGNKVSSELPAGWHDPIAILERKT